MATKPIHAPSLPSITGVRSQFRDAEYIEAVLILPPKVQSIVFVNPKDFNCGHDLHTTIQLLIVKAQGAVSQKYTSLIKQLNPLAKFNPIAKIPP